MLDDLELGENEIGFVRRPGVFYTGPLFLWGPNIFKGP